MPGRGARSTSEVTNTRSPRRRSTMPGAERLHQRPGADDVDVEMVLEAASRRRSAPRRARHDPAFDTRTSIGPTGVLGLLGECRDRCVVGEVELRPRAPSPPAALISAAIRSQTSTRRAPSTTGMTEPRQAVRAVASPIPAEAPVTTAGRARAAVRSSQRHRRRQLRESPDVDRVHPRERRLVDVVAGDPRLAAARERPVPRAGPARRRGRSAGPTAEAQQLGGVAIEVVAVRVGEHPLVTVGGADQQQAPARPPGSTPPCIAMSVVAVRASTWLEAS